MTHERLSYINKLKKNIDEAREVLSGDISLDLVVKHARKELSLKGYLSEQEVNTLKDKVRSIMVMELEKMEQEFAKL